MKTILIIVAIFMLSVTVNAQEFEFVTSTINYGKIIKGS